MINDTVECPYCEHENDMSDGTVDLPDDNRFDHECARCGGEFEVFVEFFPTYSGGKIEYVKCERCKEKSRDIVSKGTIFPFPDSLEERTICRLCYRQAMAKEYAKQL
ncbi:transcription elongation factor Elf1 [Rossellomorea marisflavi]